MNASPKEPVTDNIPVYAVSTKRKRDNNNVPDAQDNQQGSQTNASSTTDNPPEYALPNKGHESTHNAAGAGLSQQTEGVYNYAFVPVSVNLENGAQQPVIKEAKIVEKGRLAGQQY